MNVKKWSVLYIDDNRNEFDIEIDSIEEPSLDEAARAIIIQHNNSKALGDVDIVDYERLDTDRLQKEITRLGYQIIEIKQQ